MLTLNTRNVAQVVLMARELYRAEAELRAFVERMDEEEQAALVAVMWIGRGSFAPDELQEAWRTAMHEASIPTIDYLLGSPHLADHLENGLDALGVSLTDDEDDLMGGN